MIKPDTEGKLSPSDISEIRKIANHYNIGAFGTASVAARMATRAIKSSFRPSPSVGGKRKTRPKGKKQDQKEKNKTKRKKTRPKGKNKTQTNKTQFNIHHLHLNRD